MLGQKLYEREEKCEEDFKKREERQGGVLDDKKKMERTVRREEEGGRGKRVKGDKIRIRSVEIHK